MPPCIHAGHIVAALLAAAARLLDLDTYGQPGDCLAMVACKCYHAEAAPSVELTLHLRMPSSLSRCCACAATSLAGMLLVPTQVVLHPCDAWWPRFVTQHTHAEPAACVQQMLKPLTQPCTPCLHTVLTRFVPLATADWSQEAPAGANQID